MLCYPQLKNARMKLIEAVRVKDISVERLTRWFDDWEHMITKYRIQLENIYNIDESGFAIGDIEALQHIINATIHQKFQAKPGR